MITESELIYMARDTSYNTPRDHKLLILTAVKLFYNTLAHQLIMQEL